MAKARIIFLGKDKPAVYKALELAKQLFDVRQVGIGAEPPFEQVDYVISYLYPKKLKQPFLSLPCINFHSAPLPEYRGFAPYTFGILDGVKEWGVSAQDVIEVKAGQTARVPVMVEAPVGANYVLQLDVFRDDAMLPEAAQVGLDRAEIALSSLNTPATDIGENRIQRATGATLTITAPADLVPGSYNYVLEARQVTSTSDNEEQGQGVRKIFTVNVK